MTQKTRVTKTLPVEKCARGMLEIKPIIATDDGSVQTVGHTMFIHQIGKSIVLADHFREYDGQHVEVILRMVPVR